VLCRSAVQVVKEEPGRALALLHRAVALDPGRPEYWTRLGEAAQAVAGQTPAGPERTPLLLLARDALERAYRLVPADAYALDNLGKIRAALVPQGLGGPADVFAMFDAALSRDPANGVFYTDAADAALALGERERARAYAGRAAELYPRYGPPRGQLGYLALAQHRAAEALGLLQAAVARDWPGRGGAHAAAWANFAAAALQLHRDEQALAVGRQALRMAPQVVELHFLLGQALERLGRRWEAAAEYRTLLTYRPGHGEAARALSRLEAGGSP
jgi:tetratricopeptide (TPR) repeat protein